MHEYAVEILYGLVTAAVTAVAGYVGMKLKGIVEEYFNDKKMRAIAIDTARWVEQIYADFDSSEKAAKFDEAFAETLTQRGIPFTALDIARLREAAVNKLNASDWKATLTEYSNYVEEDDDSDEYVDFVDTISVE